MSTPAAYRSEQQARLVRAIASARALDQQTAARIARETAVSQQRIAPQRTAPAEMPAAAPAVVDPYLKAIANRLQFGR